MKDLYTEFTVASSCEEFLGKDHSISIYQIGNR